MNGVIFTVLWYIEHIYKRAPTSGSNRQNFWHWSNKVDRSINTRIRFKPTINLSHICLKKLLSKVGPTTSVSIICERPQPTSGSRNQFVSNTFSLFPATNQIVEREKVFQTGNYSSDNLCWEDFLKIGLNLVVGWQHEKSWPHILFYLAISF